MDEEVEEDEEVGLESGDQTEFDDSDMSEFMNVGSLILKYSLSVFIMIWLFKLADFVFCGLL